VIANLASSGGTGWQFALLAPGWLHGCMGLNLAFRHRAWDAPRRGWLVGAALALPLLAAAGYWPMTRDVEALNLPAAQRVTPGRSGAAPRARRAARASAHRLFRPAGAGARGAPRARLARSAARARDPLSAGAGSRCPRTCRAR
jgi:hypothetical protein